MSSIKGKKISGKAVIKNNYSAFFYEAFHSGKKGEDHIYRMLNSITTNHMKTIGDMIEYKKPFMGNTFIFKNGDKIICKNEHGRKCLIEDSHDRNVVINLIVTPYDFESNEGVRLTGTSIKVTGIKILPA